MSDYDYTDGSRLSASEMERVMAHPLKRKLYRQYELGIIDGGEFDCLVRRGCLPKDLPGEE